MAKCTICGKHVHSGIVVDSECLEKIIKIPVPIGEKIYVPYKYRDFDGKIEQGVEELTLSGYVKEDDREFYITYDNFGSNDIPVDKAYTTYAEAVVALNSLGVN